ncbi:MAG: phosphoenolpyruvate synthase, partial [Muribaculaceae bacterium]|nr:phosphoenolpyruvate synthase [Muribaculaceae bacterium]
DSKAYMTATSNVIDQEKMAVIIQEVIGTQVGDYYYPSFSGVGRSLNYYPIGDEKPEEGIAEVAVGLGKYIVDGGRGLRFSPLHPHHVLQTSELSLALRDTQTTLYALDHTRTEDITHIDEGFNIAKLSVQDVAATGALRYMVSTYDFRTGDRLADTDVGPGRKVVTFNNVLKHGVFPLAEGINCMLTTGQDAMKRPIEIEFAGMIDIDRKAGTKGHIYWLQIRPIIDRKELVDDSLMKNQDPLRLLLRSNTALGNGNIENLHTVVYVRTEHFDSLNNPAIAAEIAELNRRLTAESTGYVLIGPGRWGSSDPALGVPVKWSDIAGSRLIVEVALPGYRIEPSQGTHFFHNLTSMGVGYLTIDTVGEVATDAPDRLPGVCNFDLLNARPAAYESDFLRMVTFDDPLEIGLNGRTGTGVVLLPPTINKP